MKIAVRWIPRSRPTLRLYSREVPPPPLAAPYGYRFEYGFEQPSDDATDPNEYAAP
jgi:hypothetical protein